MEGDPTWVLTPLSTNIACPPTTDLVGCDIWLLGGQWGREGKIGFFGVWIWIVVKCTQPRVFIFYYTDEEFDVEEANYALAELKWR